MSPHWSAAQVLGMVALPTCLAAGATQLAARHYREAELDEFSGEAVESYLPEFMEWMADRWGLFPAAELAALGLERCPSGREHLYATAGVDPHVDGMDPAAFLLVLANDGLEFKMGRIRHKTLPGEWFVLDDRKMHEVRGAKAKTSYLVWSVPLKPVSQD